MKLFGTPIAISELLWLGPTKTKALKLSLKVVNNGVNEPPEILELSHDQD